MQDTKPTKAGDAAGGSGLRLPVDFDNQRSREEITLAEFPLTTMALKRPGVTELHIDEVVGFDEAGKPLVRAWAIVGSERYGLPIAGDEDIYVAITKMLEHREFKERVIGCSRYQICQVLAIKPDGRVYQRISDAFTRLANTKFVAENVFRDPDTGALVKREAFGILDAFRFVDRVPGAAKKDVQPELPLSYFRVSDEFLRRLRLGKLKRLDLRFWRGLSSHLTKRLFRFLDKNRYRKLEYEIGLVKLSARLGLASSNPPKELKRLLRRPLEELRDKGLLEAFDFRLGNDGLKVWCRFRPPEASERSLEPEKAISLALDPSRAPARPVARNSRPLEGDGAELYNYFRSSFHSVTDATASSGEAERIRQLLAKAGSLPVAKQVVDWILREARNTNFAIQNAAGLFANGYVDRALEYLRGVEKQIQEAAALKRKHELEGRYYRFTTEAIEGAFVALTPDEQAERIAEARAALVAQELSHGRDIEAWIPAAIERSALSRAKQQIERELNLPDFKSWRESQLKSEESPSF